MLDGIFQQVPDGQTDQHPVDPEHGRALRLIAKLHRDMGVVDRKLRLQFCRDFAQ